MTTNNQEFSSSVADDISPSASPQPDQPVSSGPSEPEAAARRQFEPDEIFATTTTFADLGLRNSVLKGVTGLGFERPTAIQATLIPAVMAGRDVLGQAKTGTGKTAAFGLPLFNMATRELAFQALILAPTRELAVQIAAELTELGKHTPIRVAAVYGGQRVSAQADKLRRDPEIIVGTPGRVMDMVERGLLHFRNIKFAVLDEVDRMLDIGFREDIRRILGMCPKERQTIFVSATISSDIEKLARNYMRDPEKIVSSHGSLTVSLVKQYHLPVQPWDKKRLLAHLLTHEEPALTVVFCRLKKTCDILERYLTDKGIDAHAIHADLSQGRRNAVMEKLRSGRLSVLLASDLASRGIDVEGITHVINYDLPEDIELYVHRIGRTARAGRGGVAWAFVTPDQGGLLTDIEAHINAEIPKLDYPDFEPGPVPEGFSVRRREPRPEGGLPSRFTQSLQVPAAQSAAVPATGEAAAMPAVTVDPAKFPGGLVPTKLPAKRMFGKIKSSR